MESQHGGPLGKTMSDEVSKLQDYLKELEARHDKAIEQLHSLANEMAHHKHLCNQPMQVDWDDLQEVVDILTGNK